MIVERRKTFPDIDPKSWEHPADRATLAAIRGVKGLDDVFRVLQGATAERSMRLIHTASSVKATPRQFARLHAMVTEIALTFDWPYRPDVFVTRSPFFNAGVYGVDRPFIVMNSSAVAVLTDEELKAVIAHEMGHIMSGHSLYKTLLWLLSNLATNIIPGGELVILPLILALAEWDRRSELTADRAGLLALQSEDPCYALLMKMAGGDDVSQMNLNDFFEQAAEYEESNSVLDNLYKVLNTAFITHPYPVVRLSELRNWAQAGHYRTIMDGFYLKRSMAKGQPADDVKVGFDFYRSEFEKSADPFGHAVKSVGEEFGKVAAGVGEGIGRAAEAALDALKGLFPGG
ncbi:MAG: M48 family metallopeptidase [Spirochaetes bacterium]|nr:M48 family metallopeptidase [Spirochaetota bacterium]